MSNGESFRAHVAIVATDLGMSSDCILGCLKKLAQERTNEALSDYAKGVRDSYINSAPIPTADLVTLRLEYMALFDN